MNERSAQLTMLRGTVIMEELYRLGVRDVCIAPGSRSTPLTLAAAEHSGLRKHIHFDERGLGFFALGCAKATGLPVVLICSSGTAAANFYPAVIEANMDCVPLLILTADRPGELQGVGANQSIDQHRLFGQHVAMFRQLEAPSDAEPPEAVLTQIDEAVAKTTKGPVHINCMFREPFVPEQPLVIGSVPSLKEWVANDHPYTPILTTYPAAVHAESLKALATARNGLLVIGRLRTPEEISAAEAVASHLEWPVCADVGSGLRLGTKAPWLMAYSNMVLETCSDLPEPDTIVHIGGAFTSKQLMQYLKRLDHVPMLQVRSNDSLINPLHRPCSVIIAELKAFEKAIIDGIWPESGLLSPWSEHNAKCKLMVQAESIKGMSNSSVVSVVAKNIGQGHAIFIGNSLSIRDMDTFAPPIFSRPVVCVNRGASGIDGNIATAAGFATGCHLPLTMFIGDLTALHDLNSLSLIKSLKNPVSLIVVNNNGGGIFHKLPIASQTDHFETYFATPHGYDFARVAEMFGLSYHAPQSLEGFEKSYSESIKSGKHLIELTLSR